MNLNHHPAWDIKDSSKLDDYLACPRSYFYRHILGWRLSIPAHDLHFGHCWHLAREYQLVNGYDDIEGAYQSFIIEYRKVFHAESDEMYNPKTPTAVLNALVTIAETYRHDLDDNEVVELDGSKMVEISGTVPIAEGRRIHYRMDSIMRRLSDQMIFSWDHKTTNGKFINNRWWADQFFLSLQNGTYTHCLYCMFPIDQVLGIEFCGVGFEFLKRGSAQRPAGHHVTLRRIPAYKTYDQMNVWLWNINDIYTNLQRDMERLYECHENDTVMMAFQQNPKSCSSYRGCPYHDYCLSWQNPLQQCYEPPLGFHVEFWNPAEKPAKNVKDLEM